MWHYLALLLRRTLWIFLFLFLTFFLLLHCPDPVLVTFAVIIRCVGVCMQGLLNDVAAFWLIESRSASASLSS